MYIQGILLPHYFLCTTCTATQVTHMHNVLPILITLWGKNTSNWKFFSENLRSFSKIFNFLSKNARDVRFVPMCNVYDVLFHKKNESTGWVLNLENTLNNVRGNTKILQKI